MKHKQAKGAQQARSCQASHGVSIDDFICNIRRRDNPENDARDQLVSC